MTQHPCVDRNTSEGVLSCRFGSLTRWWEYSRLTARKVKHVCGWRLTIRTERKIQRDSKGNQRQYTRRKYRKSLTIYTWKVQEISENIHGKSTGNQRKYTRRKYRKSLTIYTEKVQETNDNTHEKVQEISENIRGESKEISDNIHGESTGN